ncbi:hypothetical protein [Salmonirosea aquatica]|uniref:Uncharacterized protein n=1 Tax=Salmonirosea aquatica TaxID=2654236 RepID=A0A7C9BH36_9BACT|nr:hypothetical protein [Cytophagaceae bacterium SJW1-29]
MDHPTTNEDHQSGYFEKSIKNYLIEHHPDLIQGEGIQIHLMELTEDALTLFQAYDRAGMLPYEAMERALTETLKDISSPYSILKDFLIENETFLNYTTGIEDLDKQDLVLKLLAENVEQISAIQMAATPEEMTQANKELLLGVGKTLIALNKS